jgi:hypothetical protein
MCISQSAIVYNPNNDKVATFDRQRIDVEDFVSGKQDISHFYIGKIDRIDCRHPKLYYDQGMVYGQTRGFDQRHLLDLTQFREANPGPAEEQRLIVFDNAAGMPPTRYSNETVSSPAGELTPSLCQSVCVCVTVHLLFFHRGQSANRRRTTWVPMQFRRHPQKVSGQAGLYRVPRLLHGDGIARIHTSGDQATHSRRSKLQRQPP